LPANIQILNHADTATINQLICNAALIICRSGYTTIMDMLKLQKKMVVVPTPGQTEQEYLAAHLARQHYVLQFRQRNFSLAAAIEAAASFNFQYFNESMELY